MVGYVDRTFKYIHNQLFFFHLGLAVDRLPIPFSSEKDIIHNLITEIIDLVYSLKKEADATEIPICFVVDGAPLPAKASTHKARAARSRQNLRKARRLVHFFLAGPRSQDKEERFRKKFSSYAAGWIRWSKELKDLVVSSFAALGAELEFDVMTPAKLSVLTAAYEADPKVVEIGHRVGQSLIFSCDGDLLVYPYADRSVVCFWLPSAFIPPN